MPTASDVKAIVQAWDFQRAVLHGAVDQVARIGDDFIDDEKIEAMIDAMPGHLRMLRQHATRVRTLYDDTGG